MENKTKKEDAKIDLALEKYLYEQGYQTHKLFIGDDDIEMLLLTKVKLGHRVWTGILPWNVDAVMDHYYKTEKDNNTGNNH